MRAQIGFLRSLVLAGFVGLTALTVVDCGNGVAACDKQCDCEKCATSAYDACVATNESAAQDALKAGCSGQLDDVHACIVSTGVCNGTEFEAKCDAQKAALKTCLDPKK